MDEDFRTCGVCGGKAPLEDVVEHATDVTYTAAGLPLGTERIDEGAKINYACACGNRFTFISRLRRARYFGQVVICGLFAGFWGYLSMGRSRVVESLAFIAVIFGVAMLIPLLPLGLDVYARRRNPPWRGE